MTEGFGVGTLGDEFHDHSLSYCSLIAIKILYVCIFLGKEESSGNSCCPYTLLPRIRRLVFLITSQTSDPCFSHVLLYVQCSQVLFLLFNSISTF